jgi:GYF domain 2
MGKNTKYGNQEMAIDVWFLKYGGTEFGPLNTREAKNILMSNSLQEEVFVCRKGSLSWEPVAYFWETVMLYR